MPCIISIFTASMILASLVSRNEVSAEPQSSPSTTYPSPVGYGDLTDSSYSTAITSSLSAYSGLTTSPSYTYTPIATAVVTPSAPFSANSGSAAISSSVSTLLSTSTPASATPATTTPASTTPAVQIGSTGVHLEVGTGLIAVLGALAVLL